MPIIIGLNNELNTSTNKNNIFMKYFTEELPMSHSIKLKATPNIDSHIKNLYCLTPSIELS